MQRAARLHLVLHLTGVSLVLLLAGCQAGSTAVGPDGATVDGGARRASGGRDSGPDTIVARRPGSDGASSNAPDADASDAARGHTSDATGIPDARAVADAPSIAEGSAGDATASVHDAGDHEVGTHDAAGHEVGTHDAAGQDAFHEVPTFLVGGTLSGLDTGNRVVLVDNGGDSLALSADGSFTFHTPVASGAGYSVTVPNQPSPQTCTVSGGVGNVGSSNIDSVSVSCVAAPWIAGNPTDVGNWNNGNTGTFSLQENLTILTVDNGRGGEIASLEWYGHQIESGGPSEAANTGSGLQIDVVQDSLPGQLWVNPTQAGDGHGHVSRMLDWGSTSTSVFAECNPLNYANLWPTPGLAIPTASDTTMFTGLSFRVDVQPSWAGNWNVVGFKSTIVNSSSLPMPYATAQIPAFYIRANFDTLYAYDPATTVSTHVTPWAAGEVPDVSQFYWSPSTVAGAGSPGPLAGACGALFVTDVHADADNGYTAGIMGCTPDLHGSVTQLHANNQNTHGWEDSSPTTDDSNAVALYAEYVTYQKAAQPIPVGTTTFMAYLVMGTSLAEAEQQATAIYDQGYR